MLPKSPKVKNCFFFCFDHQGFLISFFFLLTVEVHVPLRHNRGSGVVLTIGQGDVGQLGLGPDELEKSRPTLVEGVPDIIDVAAGGMHTVCLTANGNCNQN